MALYKVDAKIHDPLYNRWRAMINRCKPSCVYHKYYYDKGITVCNAWLNDFYSFKDWAITHGYSPDLTIDRIDNTKGYCPENCRWITKSENTRRNSNQKLVTIDGVTQNLKEWANQLNISLASIRWAVSHRNFTYESYIKYRMKYHNISRSHLSNKQRIQIIKKSGQCISVSCKRLR